MDRLTSMQMFVSVVENRSFSITAQRIGVSNATVSKHIKRLEDDLGAKLLNRTTRNLSVTEIGEVYFDRCVNILERIEIAEHKTKSQGSKPDEKITINTSLDIGDTFLPPLLAKFRQAFAHVQLDLRLTDRYIDPVEEGFDITIRASKTPINTGQEWQLLGTSHLKVVCSPAAQERFGPVKTIGDLGQVEHLSYSLTNRRENWEFEDPSTGETLSFRANGSIHSNNRKMILNAALKGLGVALLPGFLVADALWEKSLIEYDIGLTPPKVYYYAFYPDWQHASEQIKTFHTLALEAIDEIEKRS